MSCHGSPALESDAESVVSDAEDPVAIHLEDGEMDEACTDSQEQREEVYAHVLEAAVADASAKKKPTGGKGGIRVEQTVERLQSLFETANQLEFSSYQLNGMQIKRGKIEKLNELRAKLHNDCSLWPHVPQVKVLLKWLEETVAKYIKVIPAQPAPRTCLLCFHAFLMLVVCIALVR